MFSLLLPIVTLVWVPAFPNLGEVSGIKAESVDVFPFVSERGNTIGEDCGLTAEVDEVFR